MTTNAPPAATAAPSITRVVCSPVVNEYIITSPFDPQRIVKGNPRPHRGVDIVQNPAGKDPVFAIGHGTIKNIIDDEEATKGGLDQGESITIQLSAEFRRDTGLTWTEVKYFHLWPGTIPSSLSKGMEITAGTLIGRIGNTGYSTNPHLHLEIWEGNVPINIDDESKGFFENTTDPDAGGALKGVYRADGLDDNEAQKQYEKIVAALPELQGDGKGNSNAISSLNAISSKNAVENVDDDEIRTSIISLLMDQIIEKNKGAPKKYKNFFAVNGGSDTAILPNLILGKELRENYNELTNAELANMVPYVEFYNIRINTDPNSNRIFTETVFPFDDYTQKLKLESIFYDRTGRGGNIGLKSVEWKSLATNMSNQSFIEATVKIIIQDIQDIEVVRNGITLLDFLYPGGNTVSQEFSPINFNVKMKVGWKYKKEVNVLLTDIDKKISEEELSETFYLTLVHHRFEFTEDGVCELTIDYKGMIETELENQNNYNVLDFLSPNRKVYERRVKIWKHFLEMFEQTELKSPRAIYHLIQRQTDLEKIFEFRAEVNTALLNDITGFNLAGYNQGLTQEEAETFAKPYDFPRRAFEANNAPKIFVRITTEAAEQDPGFFAWVKEAFTPPSSGYYEVEVTKLSGKTKLKTKLAKIIQEAEDDLARSYLPGISNLLQSIDINYITLKKNTVDQLKRISTVSSVLNNTQVKNYEDTIKNIINDPSIYQSFNQRPDKIKESLRKATTKQTGISSEKFVENLFKDTSVQDNYMNIPYVFLRDILEYYIHLLTSKKDKYPNSFITAIGSFSYNNFGNPKSKNLIENIGISRITPVPKGSAQYHEFEQKYANMADIPIPIDSLISWYSSHIMDANIRKMGYLDFLKSMFNDILKSSLKNSIISYAPQRSIIPSFNFITIDADKQLTKKAVGNFIKNDSIPWYDNSSTYLFNMNFDIERPGATKKQLLRTCVLYRMKRFLPESKNYNEGSRTSFLIILAKNEKDNKLNSDYKRDLEKSIPHFYIGEDKGLVKQIKFSRQDNQKLESANILRANNNEYGSVIVRQIYNLDLKMHGNNLLTPGQFLHITPTYPGARLKNPTLYQIGLGGYFVVNQISNIIEENDFETTIKAQWQMYGDGLEQKLSNNGIIKIVNTKEEGD